MVSVFSVLLVLFDTGRGAEKEKVRPAGQGIL
jgi:hypothetical protein